MKKGSLLNGINYEANGVDEMDNFIEQYIRDCNLNLSDNVFNNRIKRRFYKPIWNYIVNLVYFEDSAKHNKEE